MSDVIVVDKLTKRFELGALQRDTMLRERLISLLRSPFGGRSKSENILWALRDVSFRVAEGEVVGIIGRNGAGKSTLLKVLSKITYPTSGRVRVAGRVASLLEVGTGFHEELTGRENIYLNGSILGMKKHDLDLGLGRRVLAARGLEHRAHTPVISSNLPTCSVGWAPTRSQWSTRSESIDTTEGSAHDTYCPSTSMNLPSRGLRASVTTTR